MRSEKSYKKLRIFIASPSDVEKERSLLPAIVQELNRGLADHLGLILEVLDWRTYVDPGMGRPQQVILNKVPVNEWDVFVGILWLRFGSPTGASDPSTGREYASGTDEEFTVAYNLWNIYGKPRVMFYRCTRPPATLVGFDSEQFERIQKFFHQFEPEGAHPGLYQVFDTTESFERLIREQLQKVLLDYAEQLNSKNVEPAIISKLETSVSQSEVFVGHRKKVFIVHGHDEGMKQTVARVLEKIGLEPVILHENPNAGRTIIEKFTDFSDVAYAVILLSPDDMGYPRIQASKHARPRARQNVILELGFFIGKLGRNRVSALYREGEDYEMPSDYAGVLYIPFDSPGNWRFALIRELRACGFNVDANKIL